MRKVLLLLLFSLALVKGSFGQSTNAVTGIVTDMVDGSPIPKCSIFINGSSRGTATNEKGLFILDHIPSGSYDLVVSAIGYETYTLNFSSSQLPMEIRPKLRRKATELSAYTVEAHLDQKEAWQKWGKFFTNNFIGSMENADRCRILNRDVLRFRYAKTRGLLTVTATEPLQIENKALGYILRYQLEKFTYDEESHTVLYLGYPFFVEIGSKHEYQHQDWDYRRKKAYLGSILHFMRSLYRDSLQSEGFSVTHMVKQDDLHRYDAPVSVDSLLKPGAGRDKSLFFRGVLTVGFVNTDEFIPYRESLFWLLTPSPVLVSENGNYYPPQEVFSSGYWTHSEKISNLLPLDYKMP
jgi:hypothetical protein